jgi:hypothetical protein
MFKEIQRELNAKLKKKNEEFIKLKAQMEEKEEN